MTVTNYIYDGFQLLCETDENNNVTRTYINEPDEYTHPIGHIDEDTGKPAYYLYDGQGNTRAVTDENGDVTDTFNYDAWGNLLARTGMTNVPFQFGGEHGYYKDEELGSYYVMARVYLPLIGRWLSLDPAGFWDGINRYCYVKNQVTIEVDPSGLYCVPRCPCESKDENHHWFPQLKGKKTGERRGPGVVNAICGNPKIDIDEYTTPMYDGCRNTPHHHLTHPFKYNQKAADIADKFKNDCCLFLIAMMDLIHQAFVEIRDNLDEMNEARAKIGCDTASMPDCRMQKYSDKPGAGGNTKSDFMQKVQQACAGKTWSELYKRLGRERRLRIEGLKGATESGCDGLDFPKL